MERLKRIVDVVKSALTEFSNDGCWTYCAALSFYAIFSLPWVLVVVVHIAGWIIGEQNASREISSRLQSFAGPDVGQQIRAMLHNAAQTHGSGALPTLIGIGAIIWSSTSGFAELQEALNRAWEVQPRNSGLGDFALKRLISFLMVIAIGIILLASMAVGALVSAANGNLSFAPWLGGLWETAITWIGISFLVGLLLKVLPDATIGWKDVTLSAVVTGSLLMASKYGMSLYLAHSSFASAFGAAGSMAILLLWLYASSVIFLFGAEFARAWSRSHGRDVVPEHGAVRMYKSTFPRAA